MLLLKKRKKSAASLRYCTSSLQLTPKPWQEMLPHANMHASMARDARTCQGMASLGKLALASKADALMSPSWQAPRQARKLGLKGRYGAGLQVSDVGLSRREKRERRERDTGYLF